MSSRQGDTVTGGSSPPVIMVELKHHVHDSNDPHHDGEKVINNDNCDDTTMNDHVRWNEDDGQPSCVMHEFTRTQHGLNHKRGVFKTHSPHTTTMELRKGLNPDDVMARARVRVTRRATRRRRETEDWKTLT